jgi:hypothetical protein
MLLDMIARSVRVDFRRLDERRWSRLRKASVAAANEHGVDIGSIRETGEVEIHGFTVAWVRDPINESLSVTCASHPLFTDEFLRAKIRDLVYRSGCFGSVLMAFGD